MKKINMLLTALALTASLAACGSSADTPAESDVPEENAAVYTGVLDEKKDFMIVVNSEDGKDSYIFNLDGVSCDAKVGDTVTVTYTGDIEDFDAQLNALKIETAE